MTLAGLSPPSPHRNRRLATLCAVAVLTMVGAAFASIPFYKAFCQATGFDGTTRRASQAPATVLDRSVDVRFDANVRGNLPWTFVPQQSTQRLKVGQTGIAYFKITNHGPTAVTGHAVYNVVPEQAGAHFRNLECFCFTDQTIGAGETVEFPVVYFIDPAFATDPETRNMGEVTLSHTLYRTVQAPAETSGSGQ
jgi:cytochrome c oxidase assembly protein subunit 11